MPRAEARGSLLHVDSDILLSIIFHITGLSIDIEYERKPRFSGKGSFQFPYIISADAVFTDTSMTRSA